MSDIELFFCFFEQMDIYSTETNIAQNQRQSLGGGHKDQRTQNQLRPINHATIRHGEVPLNLKTLSPTDVAQEHPNLVKSSKRRNHLPRLLLNHPFGPVPRGASMI
jgi:hypothetical protein